jgi:hypothetical protein
MDERERVYLTRNVAAQHAAPTVASFNTETVFSRPGGVKLRAHLCGVLMYASAQPFDFLARTKKSSLPN